MKSAQTNNTLSFLRKNDEKSQNNSQIEIEFLNHRKKHFEMRLNS